MRSIFLLETAACVSLTLSRWLTIPREPLIGSSGEQTDKARQRTQKLKENARRRNNCARGGHHRRRYLPGATHDYARETKVRYFPLDGERRHPTGRPCWNTPALTVALLLCPCNGPFVAR
uniref:Putative secreted protein n=1 Tax=Ixodes ricinus TaxID=34613 RepID=A0A6B0UMU6_IXORI